MSNKKKLATNILSIGAIQIANYVFPMISIPIIARIIGPDKLGTINFASSFIAYFTLLIGFGFDLTATRRVAKDPFNEENRNKVFSEVLFAQIILLLISLIIFITCVTFVPQLKAEKEVAIFSFLICFSTVLTQNWLFQAMQDLPKVAILNLISKVIFTIIVLLLVRKKADYPWQPFALSISQIFMAALSFGWAIKRYSLKFSKVNIKDCLALLWNEKVFFFSLCIINLYTNTNILVLGFVRGAVEVGYYTAGQKLISIMQMIITIPLTQAIFPYLGKAFGEGFDKGIDIAQKIFPIIFLFSFFAGAVIFTGAPLFIHFFYGRAFQQAIVVCRILAFVPMIISLGTVLGIHIMLNLKMDKVFFRVTCTGAFISVCLNFILVRSFGYKGSAFTWTITEFANLFLLFFILKRKGINIINLKYCNPIYLIKYSKLQYANFIKMKNK